MASGAAGFVKSVIVPLIIAAVLYVLLLYIVYPIYRRYRSDIARYSQYAPLSSTLQSTTSIFGNYIPEALRPRSIREKIGDLFFRIVLPSMWAVRNRGRWGGNNDLTRTDSIVSDEDGGLFDEDSGEAMIGFDAVPGRADTGVPSGNNTTRIGNQETAAADNRAQQDEDSNRRLSRELEEGFMDDSESEASEQEVTVGRRRLSMSANG